MDFFSQPWVLLLATGIIAIVSLLMTRQSAGVDGFYNGKISGKSPSLWTLALSQVTTWIFARSLMNAAILGYFYGFAGTLAYTCYYLSFLSGGYIIWRLRSNGAQSVQDWLRVRFGHFGSGCYNIVIGLRLLSEVFANLIVIGLIFTAAFPDAVYAEPLSIISLAIIGLIYSVRGGLAASLRTDVMQMGVFFIVFITAFFIMVSGADFSLGAILTAEGVHEQGARPGWILVLVALLQVFSYPAHDPVMMDRGFIADQRRTNHSFVIAFIVSSLCIFGFGMFGIQAGLLGAGYENQLLGTWAKMFGPVVYLLLVLSLLVSAMSTLDSALSSSARLLVVELGIMKHTVVNGRLVMGGFMLMGVLLTLFPNKTLFDAVAVSGTASMFLTPVLIVCFCGGHVAIWAYFIAWGSAILGALAYMYRHTELVSHYISAAHKYDQLLYICIYVLLIGFLACGISAFVAGRQK